MSPVFPGPLALSSCVLGRFRVTGLLARGGQSLVYGVADDRGRKLALKVSRTDTADPHNRARLEQEAALLQQLDSPSIVRFVEAGMDAPSGLFCLVVEQVPGVPLAEVVGDGEVLGREDVLSVLRQIAVSLAELHALGHVLRDLTPSQVLCSRGPEGLRAVLVDLGFARHMSAETGLTDPASVAGTPGYLAPEMIDASIPTPRSDVYSLAAVGYFLIAGFCPFGGLRAEAALAAQYAGQVRPLSPGCGLPREVRQRVDRVFRRGLSPDPDSRPGTPGGFVDELAAALYSASSLWTRLWQGPGPAG